MGLVIFVILWGSAFVACGLALRDVLGRSEDDFIAIGQSRSLWRGVLMAVTVGVVLLPRMFPAALAIACMYFFVYRRRMGRLVPGPIDIEEA
ncbi:MAG: hypothetical protein GY929_01140 [Actinomycetia bacterium]|nr:hypothetical protein [Actinomycetes bacterium]